MGHEASPVLGSMVYRFGKCTYDVLSYSRYLVSTERYG